MDANELKEDELHERRMRAHDALERDARRYRRLQVLGAAPAYSSHLEQGTVLRFTGLDKYVDDDLKLHPSRGEA